MNKPHDLLWLERLGKLRKSFISSGLEPLLYRVPYSSNGHAFLRNVHIHAVAQQPIIAHHER
jgi:hypothetical protein